MEEEPERYTNPSLRLSVQLSCMHRQVGLQETNKTMGSRKSEPGHSQVLKRRRVLRGKGPGQGSINSVSPYLCITSERPRHRTDSEQLS